jgi:hypothetical protein
MGNPHSCLDPRGPTEEDRLSDIYQTIVVLENYHGYEFMTKLHLENTSVIAEHIKSAMLLYNRLEKKNLYNSARQYQTAEERVYLALELRDTLIEISIRTLFAPDQPTVPASESTPEFSLFPKLPKELRDKIWDYALPPEGRIFELGFETFSFLPPSHTSILSITKTSTEAREAVMRRYEPLAMDGANLMLDAEHDILYFSQNSPRDVERWAEARPVLKNYLDRFQNFAFVDTDIFYALSEVRFHASTPLATWLPLFKGLKTMYLVNKGQRAPSYMTEKVQFSSNKQVHELAREDMWRKGIAKRPQLERFLGTPVDHPSSTSRDNFADVKWKFVVEKRGPEPQTFKQKIEILQKRRKFPHNPERWGHKLVFTNLLWDPAEEKF